MHRLLMLAACIAFVGCATAEGDEDQVTPLDAASPSDGGSDAPGSDATIFPAEDAEPSVDTAPSAEDSGMVVVDEGVDTEPPPPATTSLPIDTLECRTVTCPSSHPYVVGCNVVLGGASSQACAVHTAGSGTVVFKEGQTCGDITLRGTITCSTAPGTGLNATNCRMNKPVPLYVSFIGACPT